jgi:GH25 family lysozyme M1 (1,4-beta-N-acetylmuramidase)
MIEGVDLGVDQGVVSLADWRTMKQKGIRFARIRCAEGLDNGIDPRFAPNVAAAQACGLPVGPYFVLHPWLDVASQVLQWFDLSKRLGTRQGELAPLIDIELAVWKDKQPDGSVVVKELSPQQVLAALVACAQKMALVWMRAVDVYSYTNFLHQKILAGGDASALSATGLHLAAYQKDPPTPPKGGPWPVVSYWQDGGGEPDLPNMYRVPNGCPCDHDQFMGTEADFAMAQDPTVQVPVPMQVVV